MNSSPLVVEWSNSERAQFEALAKSGVIVARYTGCELEVLTQCRAPGGYHYAALTPTNERERIAGKDDLYAKLPLGAVELEGRLSRSGSISVDSTVAGRYAAERVDIRERDLVGRCLGATHVVSGLTVGAFELSSGAASDLSGSASTLRFGSRGDSSSQREVISHAGDAQTCLAPPPAAPAPVAPPPAPSPPPTLDETGAVISPPAAGAAVTSPPSPPAPVEPSAAPAGCDALIRLDLAPLPEAEARHANEQRTAQLELEDERQSAKTRRTVGYVATTAGVASLLAAGLFAYLGSRQNTDIQHGGFATSQDLKDAEAAGKRDNTLGWSFGIAGGAFVGIGVPLILLSPTPDSPRDAARARAPRAH